jgi:hypothetical protein
MEAAPGAQCAYTNITHARQGGRLFCAAGECGVVVCWTWAVGCRLFELPSHHASFALAFSPFAFPRPPCTLPQPPFPLLLQKPEALGRVSSADQMPLPRAPRIASGPPSSSVSGSSGLHHHQLQQQEEDAPAPAGMGRKLRGESRLAMVGTAAATEVGEGGSQEAAGRGGRSGRKRASAPEPGPEPVGATPAGSSAGDSAAGPVAVASAVKAEGKEAPQPAANGMHAEEGEGEEEEAGEAASAQQQAGQQQQQPKAEAAGHSASASQEVGVRVDAAGKLLPQSAGEDEAEKPHARGEAAEGHAVRSSTHQQRQQAAAAAAAVEREPPMQPRGAGGAGAAAPQRRPPKALKIPKLPMVRQGKRWFRARLLRDTGGKALLGEYRGWVGGGWKGGCGSAGCVVGRGLAGPLRHNLAGSVGPSLGRRCKAAVFFLLSRPQRAPVP